MGVVIRNSLAEHKMLFQLDGRKDLQFIRWVAGNHLMRHQVVGLPAVKLTISHQRVRNFSGTPFGTVDEFVAGKASEITRLQQLSTTRNFVSLNLKEF